MAEIQKRHSETAELPSSSEQRSAESGSWKDLLERYGDSSKDTTESLSHREVAQVHEIPPPPEYPELDAYQLSPECRRQSEEVGRKLRELCSPERWKQSTLVERKEICDGFSKAIIAETGVQSDVAGQHEMDESARGLTRGNEVTFNKALLRNETPECVISTLRHEYRHVWQNEVIDGVRQHPLGEEMRDRLVRARLNYAFDRRDLRRYLTNEMELDARKSAKTSWESYTKTEKGLNSE